MSCCYRFPTGKNQTKRCGRVSLARPGGERFCKTHWKYAYCPGTRNHNITSGQCHYIHGCDPTRKMDDLRCDECKTIRTFYNVQEPDIRIKMSDINSFKAEFDPNLTETSDLE
jgi:hypothetical protein